ncbi:MAG: MBL fold metallo-hydrolase, partial [Thermoleophilaceae bacterium]
MKVTVLGKSPSWQDAGGACSGYLLQEDDVSVLLDCGNGVFSKLRQFVDYTEVDAVLLSHLHADHFLDLVPYSYALTYAPRQQPVPVPPWPGDEKPARPRLISPPWGGVFFLRVVGV